VPDCTPILYPQRPSILCETTTLSAPRGIANLDAPDRQKGAYIGRIPKGGKSADLPIVRATKFALVTTLQAERFLKARHKKISHSIVVRRIPALQDRQRTWRTTHALQKADK
jgi:hypothetical protein